MEQMRYNIPNTRARVEARRRQRQVDPGPASVQVKLAEARIQSPYAPARSLTQRVRYRTEAQKHGVAFAHSPGKVLQEQRKAKTFKRGVILSHLPPFQSDLGAEETYTPVNPFYTTNRYSSQVKPGPRRAFLHWLSTGQLFSFILFLSTIGALVLLFTSNRFQVQKIAVEGNSVLANETLAKLSGLTGASVWFIDQQAAEKRLRQNPYIEQVSLNVALPDQVKIKVLERRPEVRWQVGGVQYLVDGNGKVIDKAQNPPDSQTLVLEDTAADYQLAPRQQIDPDALKVGRALKLRLPTELGLNPSKIGWDIGLGVYLLTNEKQTIVFGQSENLDHKIAVLSYLRRAKTPFTYLDLRPSVPYYRNLTAAQGVGEGG